jgi:hypothetical protein
MLRQVDKDRQLYIYLGIGGLVDAAKWIGHSKAIQEEHYLQIVDDGVKDAMSHWKESRVNTRLTSSEWFSTL